MQHKATTILVFLVALLVAVPAIASAAPAARLQLRPRDQTASPMLAPGDFPPPEPEMPRRLASLEASADPTRVETFDLLDAAGGNWYVEQTNEEGIYAWAESYVMQAYLTMYEATGERRYLDKFVSHAVIVGAKTDLARGAHDYRGKSLPAWSAGGIYTKALLDLFNRSNRRVIRIVAYRWAYNNYTRVRVLPGSTSKRFTLSVRNRHFGVSELYRDLSMDPRSPSYFGRRIDGRSHLIKTRLLYSQAIPGRDDPKPTYFRSARPLKYHLAEMTGMIAFPLAQFAALVRRDATLSASYEETATRLLNVATRAAAVHWDEWVDAGTYGYYKFRYGGPMWCDGVELPHNQNMLMARTFLYLYAATGDVAYKSRAEKLAASFKREMWVDNNGAYVWNYWWGNGVRGWTPADSPSANTKFFRGSPGREDQFHAGVSVDFAAAAAAEGICFDDSDLVRFANTFHANMTRRDGTLTSRVNGTGVSGDMFYGSRLGANTWLSLSRLSRNVFQTGTGVLSVAWDKGNRRGAMLYGIANAVLARRLLDAEPRPLLAPVLTAKGTLPAGPVAGTFTLTVEATGETPPASFFVDSVLATRVAHSPYVLNYDTRGLRDGSHLFRMVAADSDGRTSALGLRVVVDNTNRTLSIGAPSPQAGSPNGDGYSEGAIGSLSALSTAWAR